MRSSLLARFSTVLVLSTIASAAHPEPTASEAAAARTLFDEARKLMKQGKYAEACPKLEEGARLNPGIGMRFNLASCWEHIGKTASAWSLYLDVAAAAKLAKQPDREKEARKAASKLEAKLSKLVIEVPERVAGIEIKRDGTPIGDAGLNVAAPVDPGSHIVEASAPDYEPWSTKVDVGPEKDQVTVRVPKLKAIPKPPPPKPVRAPDPEGLGPTRTTALILGGAGVVGLGIGIFFGSRALSLNEESKNHCEENLCDSEGFRLRTDARRWGSGSTIAIIAGTVGVGAAAVLWFTAPHPRDKDKASIHPWVALDGGGVSLRGAW
jgi:hypothetical protein